MVTGGQRSRRSATRDRREQDTQEQTQDEPVAATSEAGTSPSPTRGRTPAEQGAEESADDSQQSSGDVAGAQKADVAASAPAPTQGQTAAEQEFDPTSGRTSPVRGQTAPGGERRPGTDVPIDVRRDLSRRAARQSARYDPNDVVVRREGDQYVARIPESTVRTEAVIDTADALNISTTGVTTADATGDTSPTGARSVPTGVEQESVQLTDTGERALARRQAAEQIGQGVEPSDLTVQEVGRNQYRVASIGGQEVERRESTDAGPLDVETAAIEDGAQGAALQETDPTFSEEDTEQRGLGELAGDAARTIADDPVGAAETTVDATVGTGIEAMGQEAREEIARNEETIEDVTDADAIVPQSVVTDLQYAGNYIASGTTSRDRGGLAGAYADAGGLEGIGGEVGEGIAEASFAPSRAVAGTAADVGVPGAGTVEGGLRSAEESAVEPALEGAFGGAPAAVARAPGDVALLARRGEQAGRVIASDPSAADEVGTAAIGYGGLAVEQTAEQFEEEPARTAGTFGGLVAGGYLVSRGVSSAVAARRATPEARTTPTVSRAPPRSDVETTARRVDLGDELGAGGTSARQQLAVQTADAADTGRGGGLVRGRLAAEFDPRVTAIGDFRGTGARAAGAVRERIPSVGLRRDRSVRDFIQEERGTAQIPRRRQRDAPDPEEPTIRGEDIVEDLGRPERRSVFAPEDARQLRRRELEADDTPGRLRVEAEQPSVTARQGRPRFGSGLAIGTLEEPAEAGAARRAQQAAQPEVTLEQAQLPRVNVEPLERVRGRLDTDVDARSDIDTRQRTDVDTDVDTDLDLDLDRERRDVDLDFDLDADPDPDRDPRRDFDIDLPGRTTEERRGADAGFQAEEEISQFRNPLTGELVGPEARNAGPGS